MALGAGIGVGLAGVLGIYPLHFASFAAMIVGPAIYVPLMVVTKGSQYGSMGGDNLDEQPDKVTVR